MNEFDGLDLDLREIVYNDQKSVSRGDALLMQIIRLLKKEGPEEKPASVKGFGV